MKISYTQNNTDIRLGGIGFIILAALSYIALTRFHVGVEFSSWEIIANAAAFFLLLMYALIVFEIIPLKQKIRSHMQWGVFLGVIFFTLIAPIFGNTFDLSGVQQIGYHDGTAQTDYAFEELLHTRNPYAVDYGNTQFADVYGRVVFSNEGDTMPNPALTQYIYLPVTLVQGAITYIQKLFIGIVDARPMMLVAFLVSIALLLRMFRLASTNEKILLASIFLLNPIYLGYFLEGGNNTFLLLLLITAFFFLYNKKYIGSAIFFGLAFATKHFALFFLPFLIIYMYRIYADHLISKRGIKNYFYILFGTMFLFIIPFFAWSPSNFIQDTILYASGIGDAIIFPITGYGFSQLVTLFGIDIQSSFPFVIFAGIATISVGFLGVRFVRKSPTLYSVITAGTITMFAYIFFSRMMNDNYLGLVIELLCVGYVLGYCVDTKKESIKIQSNE